MKPNRYERNRRDGEHGNVQARGRDVVEGVRRGRGTIAAGTSVVCQFREIGGSSSFRGVVVSCEYSRLHQMTVVTVRSEGGVLRKIDRAHVTVIGGAR